jgi:hypothetical protein
VHAGCAKKGMQPLLWHQLLSSAAGIPGIPMATGPVDDQVLLQARHAQGDNSAIARLLT